MIPGKSGYCIFFFPVHFQTLLCLIEMLAQLKSHFVCLILELMILFALYLNVDLEFLLPIESQKAATTNGSILEKLTTIS